MFGVLIKGKDRERKSFRTIQIKGKTSLFMVLCFALGYIKSRVSILILIFFVLFNTVRNQRSAKLNECFISPTTPPFGHPSSGRRGVWLRNQSAWNSPPARGGVPRRGEVVGENTHRWWEKKFSNSLITLQK